MDEGRLTAREKKGLELIQDKVLDRFGHTGVQECINRAVFELLEKIFIYPVEDETHFTDKDGRILPDVLVMDKDCTPLDVAAEIHTDIAKHYVTAVDARSKMKMSKEHPLQHGDVVKIISKA